VVVRTLEEVPEGAQALVQAGAGPTGGILAHEAATRKRLTAGTLTTSAVSLLHLDSACRESILDVIISVLRIGRRAAADLRKGCCKADVSINPVSAVSL
jgi:hypothetical protein